ncbi:hypothetical protein E1B28_013257 [Marasmius oreades]|uniref:Uncharacterized protein n=1 Tax=Marasmius oreades TaxID=181124 RepID=A0A9P7RPC4_9AGAR|nr:uncharacterized protein E1B28_013257 [Marasmius oreades]KAG7087279.1 hypothetical protein E1B28_013257 [Marasmius oreades]
MPFAEKQTQEVPKAPKLGTKPLSLDDDEFLPDIPIKLNNFEFDPDYDVEMSYTSQSPTPTQNKDPSALFTGTDGLKSAFNSPSKRSHNGYEDGNLVRINLKFSPLHFLFLDHAISQSLRSPSEQHLRLHKGKGNMKECSQDGKGKGKAVETAEQFDDNPVTAVSATAIVNSVQNEWEAYERYSHSDQQEYNTSSTSQHRSNSTYPN